MLNWDCDSLLTLLNCHKDSLRGVLMGNDINQEIIMNYANEEPTVLARKLGITVTNLRKKASRLGLKKTTVSNKIVDAKKLCSCCNRWLEVGKFNKDKYQPNNLDYRCRSCRKLPPKTVTKTVLTHDKCNGSMAFNKPKTANPIIIRSGGEYLKCKSCLEVKALSNFHRDKGNLSGHKNFCKKCIAEKKSHKI